MLEVRDVSKMEPAYAKRYLEAMYRVKIPFPERKHVIASKLAGGLLTFWMLWRAKHDWHSLFTHFEQDKVWEIPNPKTSPLPLESE